MSLYEYWYSDIKDLLDLNYLFYILICIPDVPAFLFLGSWMKYQKKDWYLEIELKKNKEGKDSVIVFL